MSLATKEREISTSQVHLQIIVKRRYSKYGNSINQDNRTSNSHEFEDWMFLAINMVSDGKQHIDWAEIISDSLNRKLIELQETTIST